MPDEATRRHDDWVSPSLRATQSNRAAYELKFVVDLSLAAEIEVWAHRHLLLDPHADPALGNRYRITSLYFDTPTFDVAQRSAGYKQDKHRIRRYGEADVVHLERKTKANGCSVKERSTMPHEHLAKPVADWAHAWFVAETTERNLAPTAIITYERTAFGGMAYGGPVRMTFDRNARGAAARDFRCDPPTDGMALLTEQVIIEMKYLDVPPVLFKDAIAAFRLEPTGLSKYRRFAAAAGWLPVDDRSNETTEGTIDHARMA